MDNAIPAIPSPGFRKGFPSIKAYGKSWMDVIRNWQAEFIPVLERFGEEGPLSFDATRYDGTHYQREYSWQSAGADLSNVAFDLRSHALKAALAESAPPKKKMAEAEVQLDSAGAVVEFQARTRSKYYGVPMMYSEDYDAEDTNASYRAEIAAKLDQMDVDIAYAMALKHFDAPEIAHALCTCSPHIAARKGEALAAYATQTAQAAVSDPRVSAIHATTAKGVDASAAYDRVCARNWRATWERSVACSYWASQIGFLARTANFEQTCVAIANCLVLGWEKMGVLLALRANWALNNRAFEALIGDQSLNTYYFVLDLVSDWQGWQPLDRSVVPRFNKTMPKREPLFDALVAHWRHPDPDAIAPLLLAACDRHTQHSRLTTSGNLDIYAIQHWYDPFEVLLVLKLRDMAGLANPVLDHPLTATGLGKLPAPSAPYSDELLEKIIAQVRKQHPEL